jgi:hypothetical protein
MDLFAMPNEAVAKGAYWSLCGVTDDPEQARILARRWLEAGADALRAPATAAKLSP